MASHACATAHSLYPRIVSTATHMFTPAVMAQMQTQMQIALSTPKNDVTPLAFQRGMEQLWVRLPPEPSSACVPPCELAHSASTLLSASRSKQRTNKSESFSSLSLPSPESCRSHPRVSVHSSTQCSTKEVRSSPSSSSNSNSNGQTNGTVLIPGKPAPANVTVMSSVSAHVQSDVLKHKCHPHSKIEIYCHKDTKAASLKTVPCERRKVLRKSEKETHYLNTLHHVTAAEIEAELSASKLQRQNSEAVEGPEEHCLYSTLSQMRTKITSADVRLGIASYYGWKEREFIQRTIRESIVLNRREVTRDLQKMNTTWTVNTQQHMRTRAKRCSVADRNQAVASFGTSANGEVGDVSKSIKSTLKSSDIKQKVTSHRATNIRSIKSNGDVDIQRTGSPLHRSCVYKSRTVSEVGVARSGTDDLNDGGTRQSPTVTSSSAPRNLLRDDSDHQPLSKKRRPPQCGDTKLR